ncbi:thioredoxin-dependent thiol peroxidase [soil metagenome]
MDQPLATTMPLVGDEAPDFSIRDDRGHQQRLADQRGRWIVLYFYPKDDTAGCTVEACEFRDADAQFGAYRAVVWGVSPQGTDSKAAFRAKFELPFNLLADEDHAVAEAYGTWVLKENNGKTYWGVQRSTFLIDPDGRVAHVWPRVKPEGHAADVLAAIEAGVSTTGQTAG